MPRRIRSASENEIVFGMRNQVVENYDSGYNPKTISTINQRSMSTTILNDLIKELSTRPHRYEREEVVKWIQCPQRFEKEIRQLNLYLRYVSNQYNRATSYFSDMLTFDYVLIPNGVTEEQMKQDSFLKNYNKAKNFLSKFDIKSELSQLMTFIMNEDVVFTYLRENDEISVLQVFPSEYCKILQKNNIARQYSFDLRMFDLDIYKSLLPSFPEEIIKAYDDYYNGRRKTIDTWVQLNPKKAFAFKFNDWTETAISPFIGVFLDALQIADDKALQRTKNLISAKQLLHQRIPMGTNSKNDFLLDQKSAQVYHDNIKSGLDDQGYLLITSPMDVKKINLDGGASTQASITRDSENNFWSSIGSSQVLFNSEKAGNIGLTKNMLVDETYMFKIYRQFEKMLNFMLFEKTGKHNFKLKFIDTTYNNAEQKFNNYLKASQYGLPTMYHTCASLGLTPVDFDNLVTFEGITKIKERLRPLTSSFTTNSNDLMDNQNKNIESKGATDEGGRPPKTEGELADNSTIQRDQGTQEKRA